MVTEPVGTPEKLGVTVAERTTWDSPPYPTVVGAAVTMVVVGAVTTSRSEADEAEPDPAKLASPT